MNDPDPRHTSDGFDHDAIFADIVAHLNDDAAEPLDAGAPWVEVAATGTEATGTEATDNEATDNEATDIEDGSEADDDAATDKPPGGNRSAVDEPPGPPTPGLPLALPTPQIWRANEVGEDLEEHFEPLPVAPLPVGDLQFWAIIVGMCGGPLLLLYLVLFNREAGGYWILTAIAMSVGGFALLVSRMPGHAGDDDDGARL
jgi:hypothetical protein